MRFISARFRPKLSLEELSLFCGNMATCVHAGLDFPKSLRSCHRSSPSRALRAILGQAAERTAKGASLFESLAPWKNRFPAFFLPVLRCGEESGHTDDVLRYLERHCRLLAAPARTMRNTWFVPLCLMLAGSVICSILYLLLAPWAIATRFILDSAKFYAKLALTVGLAFYLPPLRKMVDYLKLGIPILGPAERELAMNRFFHAMNLLYSGGGRRVEEMIRLAAQSADNYALRCDFLRAAAVVESGGTIGDAFSVLKWLPDDFKATIITGDQAGKLDTAFESICRESAESVLFRLAQFQRLFFSAVVLSVILSITGTAVGLSIMRSLH